MDPVTLIATLNATFNGVKKLVAVGREAQDVMRQLGKWADAASQLHGYINKHENRKPGIFEKIGLAKNNSTEKHIKIIAIIPATKYSSHL
jgi:hypothetical protein